MANDLGRSVTAGNIGNTISIRFASRNATVASLRTLYDRLWRNHVGPDGVATQFLYGENNLENDHRDSGAL
jgi:hypothetical protein